MKLLRRSKGQRILLERSTLLDELDEPPLASAAVAFAIVAVGLFILWASYAVVEEVAQAPGTISGTEEALKVQHASGGVVADIFVREGDEVKAGDRILSFDQIETESILAQSTTQILSLQAQRIKLNALLRNTEADFSRLRLGDSSIVEDQRRLYQAEIEAAAVKESILSLQEAQKRSEIESLETRSRDADKQLGLAREDYAIRRVQAERGIIPRSQVIAIEREVAALETELARIPSDLRRAKDQLLEIAARRDEYRVERGKRYSDELAAVNDRLMQLDESVRRLEYGAGSLEVKAPIDGFIFGLTIAGKGEVVRPGATITAIVPKEKGYSAEMRISPRDIGSIQPGLPVRLKLSAYPFDRFGGFKGKVLGVSASTFTGGDGSPYYRALASVEGRELEGAENLAILPGMTLTGEIVTGERTIMQYILKPIYASAREAFRER